jgi:hypothetical protein
LLRNFLNQADLMKTKIVGMTKGLLLASATVRRGPQDSDPVLQATRHRSMLIFGFIA